MDSTDVRDVLDSLGKRRTDSTKLPPKPKQREDLTEIYYQGSGDKSPGKVSAALKIFGITLAIAIIASFPVDMFTKKYFTKHPTIARKTILAIIIGIGAGLSRYLLDK